MDSSILSSSTTTCSFWSAQLNFTTPVSARHFCLVGNNRYVSPPTFGGCNNDNNDNNESSNTSSSSSASGGGGGGVICRTCLSWDSSEKRDDCHYVKGHAYDVGAIPPSAGYDDYDCPVGYEKFTDVLSLDVGCPIDSVLLLEIFATTTILPSNTAVTDTTTATAATTTTDVEFQLIHDAYDFEFATPNDVTHEFEAHGCLTGKGGTNCGEDTLTLLAHHNDGNCGLKFQSGTGYKIQCKNNEYHESSSFMGGILKQNNCYDSSKGLTCSEVMTNGAGQSSSNIDIQVIDEDDNDKLCGLDQPESLNNPVAWLVGTGCILLTILPSFYHWKTGNISPIFLTGLLSEAMKNGFVIASVLSVNWSCLANYGLFLPSGNHSVLLPYALIAFSLADTLLTMIAMISKGGHDLEDSFDKFKWVDTNSILARRILTFMNIVIIGGLGGFCQLALILEGTVENHDGSNDGLSTSSSWIFIVSASIGGTIGILLTLLGVSTGHMRMAWKVYKILVGDIPGTVSSIDLAVVLAPGWVAESFNDLLHLLLYLPPLWVAASNKEEESTNQKGRGRAAVGDDDDDDDDDDDEDAKPQDDLST